MRRRHILVSAVLLIIFSIIISYSLGPKSIGFEIYSQYQTVSGSSCVETYMTTLTPVSNPTDPVHMSCPPEYTKCFWKAYNCYSNRCTVSPDMSCQVYNYKTCQGFFTSDIDVKCCDASGTTGYKLYGIKGNEVEEIVVKNPSTYTCSFSRSECSCEYAKCVGVLGDKSTEFYCGRDGQTLTVTTPSECKIIKHSCDQELCTAGTKKCDVYPYLKRQYECHPTSMEWTNLGDVCDYGCEPITGECKENPCLTWSGDCPTERCTLGVQYSGGHCGLDEYLNPFCKYENVESCPTGVCYNDFSCEVAPWTCGNGLCESGLGENNDNCCLDCPYQEGQICQEGYECREVL